jgi:hypothetical protein
VTPEQLDDVQDYIFELSKEDSLDRKGIEDAVFYLRRLLQAYRGATRQLFRQRSNRRRE